MVRIADVTLREGEQQAGRWFSKGQKIRVAEKLDELGVDYVQLGFPAVPEDDTAEICDRLDIDAKTIALTRPIEEEIRRTADSGVDTVEIVAICTDLAMEKLFDQTREEFKGRMEHAAGVAMDTGCEVRFDLADPFRADVDFLNELLDDVEADHYMLGETVGKSTPMTVERTLDALEVDFSKLGIHCHNDLGLAVAKSLLAVERGVDIVDVSVGGIGDRVGNAPLEEFVVACCAGQDTTVDLEDVDTRSLVPLCEAIAEQLDIEFSGQKPVLGEHAFEHESGLHLAGMLEDPELFEPYDPASFGGERSLKFGKGVGTGAVRRVLQRADLDASEENVERLRSLLRSSDNYFDLEETTRIAEIVAR